MGMSKNKYIIGTRGSALALWQANKVSECLEVEIQIAIIKTSGDRFQDIALQGQTETGFFTREIEDQLLAKKIDMAVHSLKDMPTKIHSDLIIAAYLPRAAVSDLLLVHSDWHSPESLIPVKKGCRVGATSLRRRSLLQLYGPQTEPAMLRGNVPTRVRKCKEGQYGAIILAQAGLDRLGLDTSPLINYRLNPEIWLPAPGQGIVAVQTRRNDQRLLDYVTKLDDPPTRIEAEIERRLLSNFEGGCHVAFGSLAKKKESGWQTFIGLDMPDKGWVQTVVFNKNIDLIKKIMPDDLNDLQAVEVKQKEMLCRKIPSSS